MKKFKVGLLLSVFVLAIIGVFTIMPSKQEVKAETVCFSDSNGTYTSLSDAISSSTTQRTITLTDNATITSDLVIPSYVTLLIPFSSSDTTGTAEGTEETALTVAAWNDASKLYKTLTIASGVTLKIEGSVILGGIQFYPGQYSQAMTSGAYSKIVNNGRINVYGTLKVHGLVTGSGSVELFNGATLYEPFLLNDYSGGTNTKAIYEGGQFPIEQYATINIQQQMKINYGSSVLGMGGLYANSTIYTQTFDLIGKTSGLILLNKEGSYIISTYDSSKFLTTLGTYTTNDNKINVKDIGKRTLNLYGGAVAGNITISYKASFLSYTASTQGKYCSIPYNFEVVLNDGVYELPSGYGYKIMPGTNFTVNEGAELVVNGMLQVYDALNITCLSNKMYPNASVLSAAGFDTIGNLIINGKMTVNGSFAGNVQTNRIGAEVTTSSGATLGASEVTNGYYSKYGSNLNKFALPANVNMYGSGLTSMTTGTTYVSGSLSSWSVPAKNITYLVAGSKSDYSVNAGSFFSPVYLKYATSSVNPNATAQGLWYVKHDHSYSLNVDYNNKTATYTCSVNANCPPIVKQAFVKPTISGSYVYSGSEQQVKFNDFNSSYMTASLVKATNSGTYNIVISLVDENATCWLDDEATTSDLTLTWTIQKQIINKYTIQSENEYNKSAFATCDNSCVVLTHKKSDGTLLYEAPTQAGSYIAIYSLASKEHCVWSDNSTDDIVINYQIKPKKINVNILSQSSAYKESLKTLSYDSNISGLLNGDNLQITLSTTANNLAVGKYDISASYTNTNYDVTFVGGENAYEVTKAQGVITATDLTVTYDGAYHKVSAVLNNSEQTLVYSANNNQKDFVEGGYEITITADETTNYTAASATAILTINKKQVNVTIDSKTSVYGEEENALTYSCSALASGDEEADLNIVLTRESGNAVGSYLISATYSNSNYNVKFNKDAYYTITPAAFKGVTFNGDSVIYDGKTHTISVDGLVEGASVSYQPEQKDFIDAGSYNIKAVISMENYTDLTLSATLVIDKKEISISINSLSSPYREALKQQEEYGYEILTENGLVEGDSKEDLAVSINVLVDFENTYLNAGEYAITATSSSKNYDVSITNGVYTITKINGVITASDKLVTYDGKYHGVEASINNDEQVLKYSNLNSFKDWCENGYEVTVYVEESTNYNAASVTKKVVINKKDIHVVINSLSSDYSAPLKKEGEYGFEISDPLQLAECDTKDDLGVVITILNELPSGFRDAGKYLITATSESNNYNVEISYGTYTINKITDEITAQDIVVTYDGKYHSVVATIGNSEQQLVYSENNFKDYSLEGYEVTITAAETTNYNAINKVVKITINKKQIDVYVDSKIVEYGKPEVELTYEVNKEQLVEGESEAVLGITLSRYEGVVPNDYAITGKSTSTNYDVSFLGEDNKENTAVYQIVKASSKVTVVKNSFIYDGQPHSVVAVVNNDSQVVLYSNNEEQVNAGSKTVTAYVEENEFYEASSVVTQLVISKQVYSYSFERETNVYDGRAHDPLIPVDFAPNLNYDYIITLDGEEVDRIVNAGRYVVTVTIDDTNYEGTFEYDYIMDKASNVINVNKSDLLVNATNVRADVSGDYLYSLDNENFVQSLSFSALTPLTGYKLYIKQLADENHYEARKTIEFTTTRSVSDVENKIDDLAGEITSSDFARLNEIAALLEEVSAEDKISIEDKIAIYGSKVSAYNTLVNSINTNATEAKKVANNMLNIVISALAAASLLGAAVVISKRFLGL